VFWSDKTTPCVAKVEPGNASLASFLVRAATGKENDQCIITLFGSEITTAGFAMYTFSVAVLVQALALISFSSVADHGWLYIIDHVHG
jgi:MFS transporter, UMF1 family